MNEQTWLVDARTLASRPTGIGIYAKRELASRMRTSPHMRFVLACDVAESAALAELVAAGAEVRTYGRRVFNSFGVLGYFRFLKRVIAEVKPDVFWQPNNLQPFRPQGVKRVIVSMHDVFGLKDWSWRYAAWHLYYRLSFRRTLRNVSEIWFNSQETARNVHAAAPQACDRLETQIVYPRTEVPARAAVAPYPAERPYFLYVGNIEVRKGADILLAAYAQYRAADGQADLIFAGPEKNVAVPRTDGIQVLGYVDDATKFSLMCSALALVVPSRAEGYGMQVAEAAALGVPCIASDLSVFREIAAKNRTTVPVADASALASALLAKK